MYSSYSAYGYPVFENQSPYQQSSPFILPEGCSPYWQPPSVIPPEPSPFIPPKPSPFIPPEPSPFIPPKPSPVIPPEPSPFIPPLNLAAEGSPFISPYTGTNSSPNPSLLSGIPNTPLYNFVPYENYYNYGPRGWERRTDSFTSFNSFIPPWIATPYPRQGYSNVAGWPSTWLPTQVMSGHPSNYSPAPSELSLHRLLSGDYDRTTLIFDLSSPKFDPMIYLGSNSLERLSEEDQRESATRPGLNHLRIECDLIPEWPIGVDINPNYFRGQIPPSRAYIPPITLGDVLLNIYSHFSQRIRHEDWAKLSLQDQIGVTKAYTARCSSLGSAETIERSRGVRRIDYARGKVWFKRLTRVGDEMEVLKLHLDKQ